MNECNAEEEDCERWVVSECDAMYSGVWPTRHLSGAMSNGQKRTRVCQLRLPVSAYVPGTTRHWSVIPLRPMSRLQWLHNFVAQLYRATKSQVWHGVSHNSRTVAQLLFRIQQCSILCKFVARENADWSILVYATKLQCATCTVALTRDDVARQNRAIKLHVWHRSKCLRLPYSIQRIPLPSRIEIDTM